jgi:hypothetical protein
MQTRVTLNGLILISELNPNAKSWQPVGSLGSAKEVVNVNDMKELEKRVKEKAEEFALDQNDVHIDNKENRKMEAKDMEKGVQEENPEEQEHNNSGASVKMAVEKRAEKTTEEVTKTMKQAHTRVPRSVPAGCQFRLAAASTSGARAGKNAATPASKPIEANRTLGEHISSTPKPAAKVSTTRLSLPPPRATVATAQKASMVKLSSGRMSLPSASASKTVLKKDTGFVGQPLAPLPISFTTARKASTVKLSSGRWSLPSASASKAGLKKDTGFVEQPPVPLGSTRVLRSQSRAMALAATPSASRTPTALIKATAVKATTTKPSFRRGDGKENKHVDPTAVKVKDTKAETGTTTNNVVAKPKVVETRLTARTRLSTAGAKGTAASVNKDEKKTEAVKKADAKKDKDEKKTNAVKKADANKDKDEKKTEAAKKADANKDKDAKKTDAVKKADANKDKDEKKTEAVKKSDANKDKEEKKTKAVKKADAIKKPNTRASTLNKGSVKENKDD